MPLRQLLWVATLSVLGAAPATVLAEALQHGRVQLVVGSVKVGFQRDQLDALRDLLDWTGSVDAPRSAPGGV